jgi:hypothetical protein
VKRWTQNSSLVAATMASARELRPAAKRNTSPTATKHCRARQRTLERNHHRGEPVRTACAPRADGSARKNARVHERIDVGAFHDD